MVDKNISGHIKQAVRWLTVTISIALMAWAIYGGTLIGGGPGFGWTQAAVLASGILLALSSLASFNWYAGMLAIYVSLGLSLLIAEILLRPFFGPRYLGVYQLDDYYLYKLIPNTTREFNLQSINKRGRVVYQVNSDGFRGEELIRDRDIRRIVVYGDSFIHAEFSPLKGTFTEQLERKLSDRLGEEVEVVNAGVAGYGPDQIARRMEVELPWLKPDLVVVGVFTGNDYGDLIRNKLYRLNRNNELRDNRFDVSEEVHLRMTLARDELLLKKIVSDVVHRLSGGEQSGAVNLNQSGNRRIETFLQKNNEEFQEYIIEGDNTVKVLANDPYNADVSLTPNSDSAVYKGKLMARVVERIKVIAEKHSTPLIFLIIPHPMDVLDGIHDSGKVDRLKYPEYRPMALSDLLQRIVSEKNIDFVNLFGPFQKQDTAQLYFSDGDDHWNELGQEVAAKELTEYLVSRKLLSR